MQNRKFPFDFQVQRNILKILGLLLLWTLVCMELGLFNQFVPASAISFDHTHPKDEVTCTSNNSFVWSDGNPFQLCPEPYPGGGNCVWWAWEQWHLLGYDLPLNWGNAADWIVDAERTGLPLGLTPRVGSIAVFPVPDRVWAFGPAGHVAFVTWVSPDSNTFNVTYQNYGDPTPIYPGKSYNVSVINEPRFQNGQLRFIYFPKPIDEHLFSQLRGVNGNDVASLSANTSSPYKLN